MSEYELVMFRAVDRPLDDSQLAYAEGQSSRAELSRREFSVEYNYSSFRGNVEGMLQRGFDVFLRYTNYGDQEIQIRLPTGLPLDKESLKTLIDGERLKWNPDRKGNAGILSLNPDTEPGAIEPVWEFDSYLDAAVELREALIHGDPRPLYVMWLCASVGDYFDPDERRTPDVPAGISAVSEQAAMILEFYGLDPLLLKAAGTEAEPAPKLLPMHELLANWISSLSESKSKAHLLQLLGEDTASAKADLIAVARAKQPKVVWPTTPLKQTFAELLDRTAELRKAENKKAAKKAAAAEKRRAAKAERERLARMKKMVKAPKQWLKKADELVEIRGTKNYDAAAEILADLREAMGGEEGDKMARNHAAHLATKYPTLKRLKSSLRKQGLWN